jgi:MarR family transcriptional regulator, organic hydroperoxide resistance regulator
MDRVEDCISFLVGKAGQQIARRSREKLAAYGVTPVQYAILKVLWERDGQSGAELGTRLAIDSATTTGIFDRLEASGFVERRADGQDRRVQRIFLTARGRTLQAPLDVAMDQLNEDVRRKLGGQAKVFWSALRTLGENSG